MRVKLYSQQLVDLTDLHESQIEIGDIAHSLALINRYNGHTSVPYSVAQHSVYLAHLMPDYVSQQLERELTPYEVQEFAFAALMHDAAEAYVGDVSNPIKEALPQIREIEDRIMEVIANRFRILPSGLDLVKTLDRVITINEMDELYSTGPGAHNIAKYGNGIPGLKITPVPWEEAERVFLQMFKQLRPREARHG